MASHLDLEEQEQIDQLKAFWKQYGNLITTLLTVVLLAFAAWNGWNWWKRDQATKAAVVFEQVDQALQSGKLDAAATLFEEVKNRFGATAVAGQSGLLLANAQVVQGKGAQARQTLEWVASSAADEGHRALAHLRLSGLLIDEKAWDEAAKQLDAVQLAEFKALVDDRRGDLALARDQKAEAVTLWTSAWKTLPATQDYRRVIEAKLTAAGAAPESVEQVK